MISPPYGRKIIYTAEKEITSANVVEVVTKEMYDHRKNSNDIDYLYKYFRGKTPIVDRKKVVRPEINNKINENHAQEVVNFKVGYLLAEPCTYVRRGEDDAVSDDINALNNFMYTEDKPSFDRELAEWFEVCGVAYRMILPDREERDESPFELDVLDPRYTFRIYHSGFGRKPLCSVMVQRDTNGGERLIVYTPKMYFEIQNGKITKRRGHRLGQIPIIEYRANNSLMGAFEPVLDIMDALNRLTSNRLDGVEQFIQSVMVFVNCDIDREKLEELKELGAVKIKSFDGNMARVEILTSELNQTQTQVLVDYLYAQLLAKTGLPSTTKGGASTSDTGSAVLLRDGWQQAETRARDTETMFIKAEKEFLKLALYICKDIRGLDLRLSDVNIKFTRHITDNALVKTQALLNMLTAGVAPLVAISHCGMFHDPADVYAQSKEYLEKWKVGEPIALQEETQETTE